MTIHTITLTINGETEIVDVPAHWTLLQMLREKLGLTGSKMDAQAANAALAR